MPLSRREFLALSFSGAIWSASESVWTLEAMEEFLANAPIVREKSLGIGITCPLKLTLHRDGIEKAAHFQSVDESKLVHQTEKVYETNFRDTWRYNVAAYRLDRILGLNMTPPSVERVHGNRRGAITWWVEDAMMELDRVRKKIEPPDGEVWNAQMQIVRVFDQLIFNTDRNLQNLLIDPRWNIWMIDHTRAFRWHSRLRNPRNLERCERRLLAALRSLNEKDLREAMGPMLDKQCVTGLLGRRDRMVQFFEKRIAELGEAAVLYDYSRV
jgi:hypothetical protein